MASLLKRYAPYVLPLFVALLYGLLLLHGANLVTADLGRHIENGKLFFEHWFPIGTNTYSYTYPDFPVINHHWLSGVLFYLVFLLGGFKGTHLFFIAASIAAFLIFFRIAEKKAGLFLASIAALFFMPLIVERSEIRPEALSYLLAGIFFHLLLRYRSGDLSPKRLLVTLAALQILWVNLHIYFFVGWILAGTFLFESILVSGFKSKETKILSLCLGALFAASLINPSMIRGALVPFTIFHQYGYRLVENQSVWFLQKIMDRPMYFFFEFALAALAVSFIGVFARKRKNIGIAEIIFALGFGAAGLFAVRNFTLFALFAFPLVAENVAHVLPPGIFSSLSSRRLVSWSAGVLLLVVLLFMSGEMRTFVAYPPFQLGLLSGNEKSAQFFLEHKITGPIFNNYDIGGYLIFYLYSKEKVFVDNRPEAYPESFFQNTYIPMQENDAIWKAQDEKIGLNSIFFSYRDFTPWAQQFLIARVKDPQWAPVYVDRYAIVFLKRNEKNRPLITQFEIPQSAFTIQHG